MTLRRDGRPTALRHRIRLAARTACTLLAATGLTALGTVNDPASAYAVHSDATMFVMDLDGTIDVRNLVTGTSTVLQDYIHGLPVDMTFNPAGTEVFFVDVIDGSVGMASTVTYAPLGSVTICERPDYLALDSATNTLYADCSADNGVPNEVDVINVANPGAPTLIARIPFPDRPYEMLADPAMNTLYVSTDQGIEEVSTASNTIEGLLPVPGGSLSVANDPTLMYDASGSDVYVIDLSYTAFVRTIPVPGGANVSAVCPSSNTLYVSGSGGTSQLYMGGGEITATYPVAVDEPTGGEGLALSPDCTTLYETTQLSYPSSIAAINTATGAVSTISPGIGYLTALGVTNVPQSVRINPRPLAQH